MWMNIRRKVSLSEDENVERRNVILESDDENNDDEGNDEIDPDGEYLIIVDGSFCKEGSAIAWIVYDRVLRKIVKEGSLDVEEGTATNSARVEYMAVIEGWYRFERIMNKIVITDNLEVYNRISGKKYDCRGKFGELDGYILHHDSDIKIEKIDKENGEIKGMGSMLDYRRTEILRVHEKVDKLAKERARKGKGEYYNRMIGVYHHNNLLVNAHVNEWVEMIYVMKEGSRLNEKADVELGYSLRTEFLKSRKGNNDKTDIRLINGIVSPKYWKRCCHKCRRKEDIYHVLFCRKDEKEIEEWDDLIETLRKQKVSTKPIEEIIAEGRVVCELNNEEDSSCDDISMELKYFTRGILQWRRIRWFVKRLRI